MHASPHLPIPSSSASLPSSPVPDPLIASPRADLDDPVLPCIIHPYPVLHIPATCHLLSATVRILPSIHAFEPAHCHCPTGHKLLLSLSLVPPAARSPARPGSPPIPYSRRPVVIPNTLRTAIPHAPMLPRTPLVPTSTATACLLRQHSRSRSRSSSARRRFSRTGVRTRAACSPFPRSHWVGWWEGDVGTRRWAVPLSRRCPGPTECRDVCSVRLWPWPYT